MTTSRSPYKSAKLIVDLLDEKSVSQSELASVTNVSAAYVNHTVTGRRLPSADWLDLVAGAMGLDEARRKKLHTTVALDMARRSGYDVDD